MMMHLMKRILGLPFGRVQRHGVAFLASLGGPMIDVGNTCRRYMHDAQGIKTKEDPVMYVLSRTKYVSSVRAYCQPSYRVCVSE